MLKVKIKSTEEVREVTQNIAHDLVDSGVAEIYKIKTTPEYQKRVITPKKRSFKRSRRKSSYKHRQLNPS